MKSVSIITLHKVRNYGSVLQTYASQKFFEEIGFNASIIDYCSQRFVENNRIEDEYERFKFKYKNPIIKILFILLMNPSLKKQRRIFETFLEENVRLSDEKYYNIEELQSNPPEADILCTGSDQVWNSETNGFIERPFYLDFGDRDICRIAFSASFGRKELSKNEMKYIKPMLMKYSGIGVRESSGMEILKDIGFENYANTLDPTLAVNPNIWQNMADDSVKKLGEYILIYEFGKKSNIEQYAKRLSEKTGLPILRIGYWYHKKYKGEYNFILPTVQEFLGLIKNAEYVITNSFHACVFSTIFKRNFFAVYPEQFGIRLKDYLDMIDMQHCHLKNVSDIDNRIVDFEIDYEKVELILNDMRKNTQKYIKELVQKEFDNE